MAELCVVVVALRFLLLSRISRTRLRRAYAKPFGVKSNQRCGEPVKTCTLLARGRTHDDKTHTQLYDITCMAVERRYESL